MSRVEAERSVEVGIEVVRVESARGLDLVAPGDMGIGNTTAASAILACLSGAPVEDVTGRGTGIDDATRLRKIETIRRAIAVNTPDPADALDVVDDALRIHREMATFQSAGVSDRGDDRAHA